MAIHKHDNQSILDAITTSTGVEQTIVQNNAFTIQDVIRRDASGVFSLAKADGDLRADALGVVSNVTPITPAMAFGTSAEFSSILPAPKVCVMDDTHTIVVYSISGSAKAVCLTRTGDTLAVGAPITFNSNNTGEIAICRMDATHAIVAYLDFSTSNYGTACCLTLSDTTLSAGIPYVFKDFGIFTSIYLSICSVDSTHSVVAYQAANDPGAYGTACCLVLSGTTISAGLPVTVSSSYAGYYTALAPMDSTHVLMVMQLAGKGEAYCLTLSGTTLVVGGNVQFDSNFVYSFSICTMDSTHAIVAYYNLSSGNYGTACCLTLSGTTPSAGIPAVFESASTSSISICSMNSTHALVSYRDVGNSGYGTACILSLSGTTITPGIASIFLSASTSDISIASSYREYAILAYRDNANKGKARVITYSENSDFTIVYDGRIEGLSGLVDGTKYYLSQSINGLMEASRPASDRAIKIMTAISTTEAIVKINEQLSTSQFNTIENLENGTFLHNNLDGRSISNVHPSTSISYDNSSSTLLSIDVKNALDELDSKIISEIDTHNELIGLQGGDPLSSLPEYYHLSEYQFNNLLLSGDNISSDDIITPNINADPGYEVTLTNELDYIWSSGKIFGFQLTDNGDGTIDIAYGVAMLRTSDTMSPFFSSLYAVKIDGVDNISLTDNDVNYIYANYNSGSPTISVSTDITTIHATDKVLLYIVTRVGTDLDYVDICRYQSDFMAKYAKKITAQAGGGEYGYGSILTESDTRKIAVTEGAFYFVNEQYTTPSFDSNGTDTFTTIYRSGANTWTRASSVTQLGNTQYNRLSDNTLQDLSNNNYGIYWVFWLLDTPTRLIVVYGQGNYSTLAEAEAAGIPTSLPPEVQTYSTGVLIAKIIFKKSATNFYSVTNPFYSYFHSSVATTHNGLSGLQGGTTDQYYHLTSTQANNLLPTATNNATLRGNGTNWIASTILTDNGSYIALSNLSQDRIVVSDSSKQLISFSAGTSTTVLHGNAIGPPSWGAIVEADITLSDNATNNVSIAKHGFTPKLSNVSTQYLDGQGNWSTPSGTASAYMSQSFSSQTTVNVTHNFGAYPIVQVIDDVGAVLVPTTIINNSINDLTVTFSVAKSGNILLTLGSPQLNNYISTANDYNTTANDYIVNETASGKTVTLHSNSELSGKIIVIKNSSSGDITVASAKNIDGSASWTLGTLDSITVYYSGTTWYII